MVTTTNRPNKYIMVMPFVTAFIILLFFIPFNRYIMHEANVPYLLLLLITILHPNRFKVNALNHGPTRKTMGSTILTKAFGGNQLSISLICLRGLHPQA